MPTVSRRAFLAVSAGALSVSRAPGANDRIRFGIIGAGARGTLHVRNLARRGDAEIAALCDVYKPRAEAAAMLAGPAARVTRDYRRVLDRRDIDAVVIATPDHLHAPILLDALTAGKDVYVEKPMTHRIEEGLAIAAAVRRSGRIVQTGTQQTSGAHFLEAKRRFFDSGLIGRVGLVRTWWVAGRDSLRLPPASFRYDPASLDWGGFLGAAPGRPFDARRFFGWSGYSDYSAGQAGDLLIHTADVAHMMLDLAAPRSVVASGGIYDFAEYRDMPDTLGVLAEYPNGTVVTLDATLSGERASADCEFHGTGGVLSIFRRGYRFQPAGKGAPAITARGQDCDAPHMERFLEAIRTRRQPNADVVYSHYLAAVCHMANMAYTCGERVAWNAEWNV